jgi:hypothetical protein
MGNTAHSEPVSLEDMEEQIDEPTVEMETMELIEKENLFLRFTHWLTNLYGTKTGINQS